MRQNCSALVPVSAPASRRARKREAERSGIGRRKTKRERQIKRERGKERYRENDPKQGKMQLFVNN